MPHTMFALLVLSSALLLAHRQRTISRAHDEQMLRGEVELRIAEAAQQVLAAGTALPLVAPAAPPPGADFSFSGAAALDAWHGQTDTLGVPTTRGTIPAVVTARVERVARDATGHLAPTSDARAVRHVTLTAHGPLGVRVTLDRLYAGAR